uniref:Uncharacterized protein n=1 Tax=Romanomermis culicivorax TaxID=13658 RepID=A0A915KJA2_ROMCU
MQAPNDLLTSIAYCTFNFGTFLLSLTLISSIKLLAKAFKYAESRLFFKYSNSSSITKFMACVNSCIMTRPVFELLWKPSHACKPRPSETTINVLNILLISNSSCLKVLSKRFDYKNNYIYTVTLEMQYPDQLSIDLNAIPNINVLRPANVLALICPVEIWEYNFDQLMQFRVVLLQFTPRTYPVTLSINPASKAPKYASSNIIFKSSKPQSTALLIA